MEEIDLRSMGISASSRGGLLFKTEGERVSPAALRPSRKKTGRNAMA